MSSISLNTHRGMSSLEDSRQLLRRFHLDRHTLASSTAANRFICKALNGPSGLRYVDASPIFKAVQHALGSSAERTFNLLGSSQVTLDAIAEYVNVELDAFVCGRKSSSVTVFHQDYGNGAIRLLPATGKNALFSRLVDNTTVLIPTGMTSSPEAGGESVHLRMDVSRSRRSNTLMTAREFLFTNASGNSIAGLGDIPDFILNIDDANDALKEVLGVGYDVKDCNARIFDAWLLHKRTDKEGDSIHITLPGNQKTGRKVTMLMKRTSSTAWEVYLNDGTDTRTLAAYVSGFDVEIDIDSLLAESGQVEDALSSVDDVISVTNFGHIFADHLDRFPEEFRELFNRDYEEAVEQFVKELERSRAVPSEWQPVPYHCGNEKRLELNGDAVFTRIQVLLPLYLTGDDRKRHSASVFAIAGLKRNPVSNEASCSFPSILDRRRAIANIHSFRRMLRRANARRHFGLVA